MKLSEALAGVRVAMMDASQKAGVRRLNVLRDSSPCGPGCSACCSRLIHVSVAEALVMYEHLVKSGAWPAVRDRAREQAGLAMLAHPVAWFKMNRPCPALDPATRLCSAYAVRPTPCSTHFVTSPPQSCDPWSAGGGEYRLAGMDDIHDRFTELLGREVAGRGVLGNRLPMPVVLLAAEKLQVHTNMAFGDVLEMISSELK